MPVLTLSANSYLQYGYQVPRNGLVAYYVEAERPVNTYVVDKTGLDQFLRGEPYVNSYGGFQDRPQHRQEVVLPFQGWWYLIILNRNPWPVAVYYQVRA